MAERQMSKEERGELRNQIEKAVDRRVELLIAEDPQFNSRIFERTRKIAIGKLKIDKELLEIDKLDEQIRLLEDKKKSLVRKTELQLPRTGKLKEKQRYDADLYDVCEARETICSAINKIIEALLPGEEAKDPIGKKISEIRNLGHKLHATLAKSTYRSELLTGDDAFSEGLQELIGD